MKLGKIPKKLKFYCRENTKIGFRWSDVEFEDTSVSDISAIPVFITDAENPKTQSTALSWVTQKYWHEDPLTNKRGYVSRPHMIIERDNTAVKSVRIVGLDIRGNGGRAYRALVDETYLVDMREDVMLDTMINVGMGVNATLPGEYIFAQIGSEMKLIRVGSKLHDMMVETTTFGEKQPITKLIPGRIYASKTKTILYLGEVWHTPVYVPYDGYYRKYLTPAVEKPVKRHLCIDAGTVSSNLQTVLGKDITWFTAHVTLSEKQSKAYREELAIIENFDLEKTLTEIRRRIEVCFDDNSKRQHWSDHIGNIEYYSSMNISTTPGWIHPKIQQHLPK